MSVAFELWRDPSGETHVVEEGEGNALCHRSITLLKAGQRASLEYERKFHYTEEVEPSCEECAAYLHEACEEADFMENWEYERGVA